MAAFCFDTDTRTSLVQGEGVEGEVDNTLFVLVMSEPSWKPPSEFTCPISHEIMEEPVTTADGNTYDKENILAWFALGNITSPLTGEQLNTRRITPNRTLARAIIQFQESIPEQNRQARELVDLQACLQICELDLMESRAKGKHMIPIDD